VGHAANILEMRNKNTIFVAKSEGKRQVGRIIIEWILKKRVDL